MTGGLKARIEQIESTQQMPEGTVHMLLELCMAVTGRGEVQDDYARAIDFPIGDLYINSDIYYGRITVYSIDDENEMDYVIEDAEMISKLIDEIKKRLLTFDKRIKKTRDELTKQIFDKPLTCINLKD